MSELTGRELDAAVARELFLRDVQRMGDTWLQWPRNAPTADGVIVPDYSTDIAAAWQVFEHFAGEKLVEDWWGAPAANRYYCLLYLGGPGGKRIEGYGATAPEAICRAALAAVRVTTAPASPSAP